MMGKDVRPVIFFLFLLLFCFKVKIVYLQQNSN